MRTKQFYQHPLVLSGYDVVDNKLPAEMKSKKHYLDRWCFFCKWVLSHHDMRHIGGITFEVVLGYGRYLQQLQTAGRFSTSGTPKTYLSAVNTVMVYAKDGAKRVAQILRIFG